MKPVNPIATLLVSCRDRTGLVAALSELVFRHGGNILDMDQHVDQESGLFFMRLSWDVATFQLDRPATSAALETIGGQLKISWDLSYSDQRSRVAVFASKLPHCLYDLLLSHQLSELGGEIVAVVSNHDALRSVAEHFGIPYHHVPMDPSRKQDGEAIQRKLLDALNVNLVVLARYMQILTPSFTDDWTGRIINIHHSFLPAFMGARPYHQAKERGVKVIGATAHYVNSELDQGPIIEQDVCRVSHRDSVDEMVQKGRELERQVLTRAVRLHLDRRVLISGSRTIVFQ
jgi:formyltetrahydrofolate deformylase